MIAARIEHSEAGQCPRHEMVVKRLIAAERFQRQFAFAKGEEERMPFGMPALANCQDPIGDRKIAVACHCRYLPRRDDFSQHSGRGRARQKGTKSSSGGPLRGHYGAEAGLSCLRLPPTALPLRGRGRVGASSASAGRGALSCRPRMRAAQPCCERFAAV